MEWPASARVRRHTAGARRKRSVDTLDERNVAPACAQELNGYLSDYAEHQFCEWKETVEVELQDEGSGLAMQLTGKLMEVDKDDLSLRVNYSDRLVRLLLPLPRSSCP